MSSYIRVNMVMHTNIVLVVSKLDSQTATNSHIKYLYTYINYEFNWWECVLSNYFHNQMQKNVKRILTEFTHTHTHTHAAVIYILSHIL